MPCSSTLFDFPGGGVKCPAGLPDDLHVSSAVFVVRRAPETCERLTIEGVVRAVEATASYSLEIGGSVPIDGISEYLNNGYETIK